MKVRDITSYLEQWAPLSLQENYDNSGLLVGSPNADVEQVLVALDVTEEVIDEAIQRQCQMVIAHHPLIFRGLKRITGANYVERSVIKAIKHDVAIYAIHTNLDNVQHGVNKKIAEKLGLQDLKILQPKGQLLRKLFTFAPKDHAEAVRQAIFKAGGGHIGNYDSCSFNTEGTGTFRGLEGTNPFVGTQGKQHFEEEVKIEVVFPAYLEVQIIQAVMAAHPYEEVAYDVVALENQYQGAGAGMVGILPEPVEEIIFLEKVKKAMQTNCIRYTRLRNKKVQKVAVCGGAGSFLLKDAIRAGADAFITGDFKYHEFFDAEGKIVIADIGHYESEQFTKDLIRGFLTEKFTTFAVLLAKADSNPIKYL